MTRNSSSSTRQDLLVSWSEMIVLSIFAGAGIYATIETIGRQLQVARLLRQMAPSKQTAIPWNGRGKTSSLLQKPEKEEESDKQQIPECSLESMILSQEIKDALQSIIQHEKARSVLFEKWGFETLHKSKQGITALFCGVPGTGKSMAAEYVVPSYTDGHFCILNRALPTPN